MTKVLRLDDALKRKPGRPTRSRNRTMIRIAFDHDGRVLRAQDADPQIRVWLAELVTDARVINNGRPWPLQLSLAFQH